jgi:tRNA(Ile)-lysidine synthase
MLCVSDLVRRVEKSIAQQGLLAMSDPVLVAVSGGVDSIALLHLLHELSGVHHWQLTIGHFNHQLRGKESDGDERFVVRLARQLGLACEVGRGDVRQFARERKLSVEMAARAMRHEFLARTARRLGMGKVALAHHADDQLELFFLRLSRGAGPDGLAGMKSSRPSPADWDVTLLRPLLGEPKAELIAFAEARRLKFRQDKSNRSPDHMRNRIRHKLLPLLRRTYQGELHRTIPRAMELMRADAEFVIATARQWLRKRRRIWSELPLAVQRAVVHEELLRLGIRPQFEWIEQLRSGEDWVSVATAVACRRRTDGSLEKRGGMESVEFDSSEAFIILGGRRGAMRFDSRMFRWRLHRSQTKRARPVRHEESFDATAIGDRIILRYWRPGDRFQPIGMKQSVKLQDLFVNAKIPVARRRELVVATTLAGDIFWVEGLRIGERFKIGEGTRQILQWRWEPMQ